MLYIWTYASILSYDKMLSYAKYLISDICGQHLNNSELHKYYMLTSYDNIIFLTKAIFYNIGRNVRSVTFGETAKNSSVTRKYSQVLPPFSEIMDLTLLHKQQGSRQCGFSWIFLFFCLFLFLFFFFESLSDISCLSHK